MYEAVFYPTEYGVIPQTLEDDGDPLDIMVLSTFPTFPGCVISCRPIGALRLNDSGEEDNKVIAVPADDPRFERKGDDLYTTVDVDLYTAILGGTVRVPTLSGEVQLKIPGGSQNGKSFRLRGKGMPNLRKPNQYGDLFAQLSVRLPTNLSPQQRELFEQLKDLDKG